MGYLKCSASGIVLDEKMVKDGCPACGVKKEAMMPYELNISERRKKLLDLHLHPISTHLSVGFSILLVLLSFWALIDNNPPTFVLNTMYLLAMALPFAVLLTALLGILDGKLRYKTVKTQFLKLKIVVGLVFLAVSIANAILIGLTVNILSVGGWIFGLSLVSFMCAGFLGFIGGALVCAKMPGSMK